MKIDVKKESTLLGLLLETFPQSTKTHLRKVIKYGFVTRGSAVLKTPESRVKAGDTLNYKKYNGKEVKKEKAPFQIVYEDEALIAVLKPAGILTVGTTTEKKKSMYKAVLDFVTKESDQRSKIFVVHRLDREVAGILLFAKSETAKRRLIDSWDKHQKFYRALVEARPSPLNSTIKSYLVEGPKQKMLVVDNPNEGHYPAGKEPQLAMTKYTTLSQHGDYTLLDVELLTGRKNQIRIHLSSIGCPIVGDRKYGADARYVRQVRLFAYQLGIIHPVTGKKVNLEVSVPTKFLKVADYDEKY